MMTMMTADIFMPLLQKYSLDTGLAFHADSDLVTKYISVKLQYINKAFLH